MTNEADAVDTSDAACAVICMLVSNPQGVMRKDGDGWQRRVNDLIRALRDERNTLRLSQPSGEEIRARALEDAAKIADVWAATTPNLEKSDNPIAARMIATVASDTGRRIAMSIRSLPLSSGSNKSDDGKKGQAGK